MKLHRGRVTEERKNYYVVQTESGETFQSLLKGIARKKQKRLAVGDIVEIAPFDDADEQKAIIKRVEKRKNELPRPVVANIDQVLLVNCFIEPQYDTAYIDRFLFAASVANIDVHLIFNKVDILDEEEREDLEEFTSHYEDAGYGITYTTVHNPEDVEKVKELCRGKLTVFAGPSGVGKSSMMQQIFPDHSFETNELSKHISRGKNTTTHTSLLSLDETSFVVDTPGFSYMKLPKVDPDEVNAHFPEILELSRGCKFRNCKHRDEPQCAVKEALEADELEADRYYNFLDLVDLMEEAKNNMKIRHSDYI